MTRERRYLISKLDRAVSNSGKNGGEMARSTWRGKNKNSVWRFDAVNWSDVTRRSNHPRQSSFEPRFTPRCSSRNFFYLKQGGEGRGAIMARDRSKNTPSSRARFVLESFSLATRFFLARSPLTVANYCAQYRRGFCFCFLARKVCKNRSLKS